MPESGYDVDHRLRVLGDTCGVDLYFPTHSSYKVPAILNGIVNANRVKATRNVVSKRPELQ